MRGFSLVELSIVLVILGLLTGGILAGQSLIRASELRSVSSDYQRHLVAVQTFRDKYFALPGDMTNATAFWTSLGGTGSNAVCQVIAATGTATCNGDGDGTLLNYVGGTNTGYEAYRVWQHLANAGLVEGQYTGVEGSGGVPGVNIPRGKISNTGWWAGAGRNYTSPGASTYHAGDATRMRGDYGRNMMYLQSTTASSATAGSMPLTPQEAWNIDIKLDDGLPGSGFAGYYKGNGTNTNCTTFAGVAPPGDTGATYLLSNNSKDCFLYFVRTF